jgi:lysozyme
MDAPRLVAGGVILAALAVIFQRAASAAAAVQYDPQTGQWYDAEGTPLPDYVPPPDVPPSVQIAPEAAAAAPDYVPPYDQGGGAWESSALSTPEGGATADTAGAVNLDAEITAEAPGIVAQALTVAFSPSINFDPLTNPNVRAFLDMIAFSEGADYSTLFGGGTFDSFADHPRQIVRANGYASSAAGRYQILQKTWDDVRGKIGAADFSPDAQDAAAVYLIKRRGALPDVIAGRFTQAIQKVRKEWASLPGAGYGQPERALSRLRDVYLAAGGQIVTV